jgi:hypothetical protein
MTGIRTNFKQTIDNERCRAYRADRAGWTFHVTFTNRANVLAVVFVGLELKELWEVVAYAVGPDERVVNLAESSNVQCEESDDVAAFNIMRHLWQQVST